MSLSPKAIVALITFLVLWIIWCFFVINVIMPWVEMRLAIWHWLTSWILCLLPPVAVAAVITARVRKGRL